VDRARIEAEVVVGAPRAVAIPLSGSPGEGLTLSGAALDGFLAFAPDALATIRKIQSSIAAVTQAAEIATTATPT